MSYGNHEHGPFGNYERNTSGHILNALCYLGVPLTVVEDLNVGNNGKLHLRGKEYGTYKYFDGIERPLFRFQERAFENACDHEGNYMLCLSTHDTPGLILTGEHHATELAWETIKRCLTNYMTDPFYKLSQESGAFFQGGSNDKDGGFLYVEFWKPAGAQAWVDGFNAELKKRRQEEGKR